MKLWAKILKIGSNGSIWDLRRALLFFAIINLGTKIVYKDHKRRRLKDTTLINSAVVTDQHLNLINFNGGLNEQEFY